MLLLMSRTASDATDVPKSEGSGPSIWLLLTLTQISVLSDISGSEPVIWLSDRSSTHTLIGSASAVGDFEFECRQLS